MVKLSMSRVKKYRKPKKKRGFKIIVRLVLVIALFFFIANIFVNKTVKQEDIPPWVNQQLIVSETSPKDKNISRVKDVVIHYVANPGSSAMANRNYFADPNSHVNAHFVVGLKGEVVQCMPLYLKSAASNNRNNDTISIEVCHPNSTGKFNSKTTASLVKLTAWVCDEFGISRKHIIRHGDITGKNCPKYFMENEYAWMEFKQKVEKY